MELLQMTWMQKPLWLWLGFLGLIITLIAIDLGVMNAKKTEISMKKSLYLSLFYLIIGLSFGGVVFYYFGPQAASEYWTAYLVEESLSIDNIFVMSLIFNYFAVPRQYQHRVLFWGIFGVIIMRGVMIGLGAVLVSRFEWITYIFAGFLVMTGIKMLMMKEEVIDIGANRILIFLRKYLRVTHDFHGHRFLVRLPKPGQPHVKVVWGTPLLLALILIECADLVFAVDSVPAVFTVTNDPYIIYTSNIFAVLGLRALYFSLAVIIHKFHYLKYALSLILIFIGGKVFVASLMGLEKIPATVSLGVTVAFLVGGIVLSLLKSPKHA